MRCVNYFAVHNFRFIGTKKCRSGFSRLRFCMNSRRQRCALIAVCLLFLFAAFRIVNQLFPEIEMVLNSPCNNPLSQWDGKILRFQVWYNAMKRKPCYFNIHNEYSINKSYQTFPDYRPHYHKPIIYWGTHHKTGTFLAKKIFSKICAKMNWCCIFLSSRDSIHAVNGALQSEPVDVLGHNHWVWGPKFERMKNYRFIHFYRDPFKKIISGYRYHYDGIEEWTKKILPFEKACAFSSPLFEQRQIIDLDSMLSHCTSAHVCETCCRKAHELLPSLPKHYSHLRNSSVSSNIQTSNFRPVFMSRPKSDYDFLCEHLGKKLKGRSLQDGLQTMPPEKGILTQAALDFYEILRMATIYNETKADRNSLNLDLDVVSEEFDTSMRVLLDFLRDLIPDSRMRVEIRNELKFYDLNSSPLYRLSMENPVINHVNVASKKASGRFDYKQALENNSDFTNAYRNIFELLN